jgi:hypothetical protein
VEDSNVTVLGLTARLLNIVSDAVECGLSQDEVNNALTATQQVFGQLGPSDQRKSTGKPGTAPSK